MTNTEKLEIIKDYAETRVKELNNELKLLSCNHKYLSENQMLLDEMRNEAHLWCQVICTANQNLKKQ